MEKARHFGGNSIVSGGGTILAKDAAKAAEYLSRINSGNTPDDVIQRMAQGLTGLGDYLRELAHAVGMEIEFSEVGKAATYPYPGGETLYTAKVAATDSFKGYPWARGLRGGARLFKVVADNVERRGIEVWYSSPAKRLLTHRGEVTGLVVERDGQEVSIKARRGVVLATGGFENNEQMRRQFFPALPVYPVCTLTNTGDGILMAQKVGAALWHMWHFHGSYGIKIPEFPFAFRTSLRNRSSGSMVVPWILVDQLGRRFTNEYPPAVQDTGARGFEHFDPDLLCHPRIPSFIVFDDSGRGLGPIALVTTNDEDHFYAWSEDNSAEIERGWIVRANSLKELAEQIRVDTSVLGRTVGRWNDHCAVGSDPDFSRPPSSMLPISRPPFYAVPVWPVVTNTQGGPVHDVEQRIVDAFGNPIPRLYAAGEMGSLFGFVYQLSGNIAECFIGGRISGRNAATEEPW